MSKLARYGKVHIEISNLCNLECSFCPSVERPKGFMTPETFGRVLEEVAPLAEQVCLHLMGEPLMHREFAAFVDACAAKQVKIFLVTNGVLLREKHSEILLSPAFRQINFSLHSFFDNFPEKDPGPYLERVFEFTERAFDDRPDLYINYRLWNLEHVRGTGEKNREMLQRIERRFCAKVGDDLDVRTRKSRHLKNRLYLHFDTEFIWPDLNLPVLGERGTCHGLSTHFGILVDGTVVPCCLDKEGAIPLGRVGERPLVEILASHRAEEIRKGFREGRLVEELCRKCQYIERFSGKSSPKFQY